jgi:hypothetical protein
MRSRRLRLSQSLARRASVQPSDGAFDNPSLGQRDKVLCWRSSRHCLLGDTRGRQPRPAIRTWHDDREFVAAEARQSDIAELRRQYLAHSEKSPIAGRVTVCAIDGLNPSRSSINKAARQCGLSQ